jgi:hypothetical protein
MVHAIKLADELWEEQLFEESQLEEVVKYSLDDDKGAAARTAPPPAAGQDEKPAEADHELFVYRVEFYVSAGQTKDQIREMLEDLIRNYGHHMQLDSLVLPACTIEVPKKIDADGRGVC